MQVSKSKKYYADTCAGSLDLEHTCRLWDGWGRLSLLFFCQSGFSWLSSVLGAVRLTRMERADKRFWIPTMCVCVAPRPTTWYCRCCLYHAPFLSVFLSFYFSLNSPTVSQASFFKMLEAKKRHQNHSDRDHVFSIPRKCLNKGLAWLGLAWKSSTSVRHACQQR